MHRALPPGFLTLVATCATCLLSHNALAQVVAEAVPDEVETSALRSALNRYTLVSLDADQVAAKLALRKEFTIDLPSGRALRIDMRETSQTGGDYALRTESAAGRAIRRGSAARTFQGERVAGASASLTVGEDFIQGQLPQNDGAWYIEPARRLAPQAPPGTYVVYRAEDAKTDAALRCGVRDVRDKQRELQPVLAQAAELRADDGPCVKVDLAIASDFEVYRANGSDAAATEAFVIGVINSIESDYQGVFEKDIDFTIVEQFVSTSATSSLEEFLAETSDASELLESFSAWGRRSSGFVEDFDLSQLWVQRDLVDGFGEELYGLAFEPGACTERGRAAVLQNFSTSIADLRTLLSHEIGHNFGMQHDSPNSGFIMARPFVASSTWSADSKLALDTYVDITACVQGRHALDEGSPVALFGLPEQACVGQEVNLINVLGRDPESSSWLTSEGSPTASLTTNAAVVYASEGTKQIELSTTNGVCGTPVTSTVSRSLSVVPEVPPAAACLPDFRNEATEGSTPVGRGVGISRVRLAEVAVESKLASELGYAYSDYTCSRVFQTDSLNVKFDVRLSEALDAEQVIKIYLDADDNGEFGSDEELYADFIPVGNPFVRERPGTLTVPDSVVRDKLLRLRVIATRAGSLAEVDACTNSPYQEVEDYGLQVNSAPLPVELLTYGASALADHVQLDWTVANEVDVDRYRVEHSSAYEPWTEIGHVVASRKQRYGYVHRSPGYGTHYYRLVSVDADGSESTSKQIVLTLRASEREMLVERNPLPGGIAEVRLAGWVPRSDLSLEVLDMQGRPVASAKTQADAAGNARFTSDLSAVGSGIYVLTVRSATGQEQLLVRR